MHSHQRSYVFEASLRRIAGREQGRIEPPPAGSAFCAIRACLSQWLDAASSPAAYVATRVLFWGSLGPRALWETYR